MDIDLRKTAADAAYIVVGVGVLSFQQAQVRRREAGVRLDTLRKDARSTLETQAGSLKAHASGLKAHAGNLKTHADGIGSTLGNSVGTAKGSLGTVKGSFGTATDAAKGSLSTATDGITTAVGTVTTQVRDAAGSVRTVDPRQWVEPVVGDLKVRVEPVVAQIKTISVPEAFTTIPDQLTKAIDVGRARVQGIRSTAAAPEPTAVADGSTPKASPAAEA